MDQYDVVVIGAGPGGYVAAIRCAQLGLRTACIDNWRDKQGRPALGGTCLNVGCIPSKALLDSSHHYHRLQHEFAAHGIKVDGATMDAAAMVERKDGIVRTLTDGIALLFAKHKIAWLQGHGRLLGNNQLEILPQDAAGKADEKNRYTVAAKNTIIATGSVAAPHPLAVFDGTRIVDSSGALDFTETPKHLGVIGAGVIALELGSVWRRLGAQVEIFSRGDAFLPRVEAQLAAEAYRLFTAQGMDIHLGARIKEVRTGKKQVALTYEDKEGRHKRVFDRLLVATGRRPNTAGLNAEGAGLNLDENGFITVDEQCRTNLPGVYAIGDVVRGPLLAHKASEEGIAVAERIAGQHGEVNYATIPWVIYTSPEIAWVGKTSRELREAGVDFREGMFPFSANGRARALGEAHGMVKILADAGTDRILGVHILGPQASEMITEAVTAMEFHASAEDIARTTHAHPTLSEALREAALAVDRRAIHR
ncbi:MAG: dihydrolipoyl dehydrogenase [Gammaproteobacteria bacterium]|nr:dihydrolipoyl dehydrogenase [Gammaproteobacteria bacterium]